MSAMSDALRGFLVAGKGKKFIAKDYNAIEARVVAWLAGQESVLVIFRNGEDIYVYQAKDIFGGDIDDFKRSVGKVAILALGFQGGVFAFYAMAKGYNISMAPALPALWAKADEYTRERALARYNQEKDKADEKGINKQEWLASELTKIAWRNSNPMIVQYWSDVENAAIEAVQNPGRVTSAGPGKRALKFKVAGSFLFMRLPSGRSLCYPYPRISEKETPWGQKRPTLTYMGVDSMTKQWSRQYAYGGLLVENATQAVARDLLAGAMVRLDRNNFEIVLHVHDEVVVEADQGDDVDAEIQRIMTIVPPWAEGLPIAAGGWQGARYKK